MNNLTDVTVRECKDGFDNRGMRIQDLIVVM